ncbi:hypothetical protein [Tunicatimonas pelagia]|uniref:hypothetical protein n=1 Tax=Tunicatimonas pelagia TaxID=931531 RepID=UPI0026655515|nr:hypothetical protein [Tunicatimonas pelagia]WKN40620.1 hypothetical protein P0M28_16400 [Tunicatimonas pelagia]
MIQTFTLDDAVRYTYEEMSAEEAHRFEEALCLDSELMDMFQKLHSVKSRLENVSIEKNPSNQTVNRILAYSKTFDIRVAEE